MNLYLISQDVNNDYDTYYSAVVCATSEDDARLIYPTLDDEHRAQWWPGAGRWSWGDSEWCKPDQVNVRLIGRASDDIKPGTVVCSSFNAG